MLGITDLVGEIAPFLVTEHFAVRDEQLQIARVGLISRRIINFIDDPVREREPEGAAGVISSPETFLCAARPARLNPNDQKPLP